MRESTSRDEGQSQTLGSGQGESAMRDAGRRLERALSGLDAVLAARPAQSEDQRLGQAAMEQDRSDLAAKLDAARARERALEDVARAASAALGRAAAEVRAALGSQSQAGVVDAAPDLVEAESSAGSANGAEVSEEEAA